MNASFILDAGALNRLNGSALFYPCSGNDLRVPIRMFSPHVTEVCGKLMDGGLGVTDGSQRKVLCNWSRSGAYHQLSQYVEGKGLGKDMEPAEFVRPTPPFRDPEGRRFTCVGYAGYRYGPTLVWKVEMHPWNDV